MKIMQSKYEKAVSKNRKYNQFLIDVASENDIRITAKLEKLLLKKATTNKQKLLVRNVLPKLIRLMDILGDKETVYFINNFEEIKTKLKQVRAECSQTT